MTTNSDVRAKSLTTRCTSAYGHRRTTLTRAYSNRTALPPGEHAKFPAPPHNAGAHGETTKVYYGKDFGAGFAVILLLSTQLLGYGVAGLLLKTLVDPAAMIWPQGMRAM